jgi:hypothetical protein
MSSGQVSESIVAQAALPPGDSVWLRLTAVPSGTSWQPDGNTTDALLASAGGWGSHYKPHLLSMAGKAA